MYKTVDFLGLKIGALTADEMIEKIMEFALGGKNKMMAYLNAHCINISFQDSEYRNILRNSDLVYAGGKGIVWASRLFKEALPQRVNILDFFDRLAVELSSRNIGIYLLGGKSDVIKNAAARLKRPPFNLRILGFHHGFFDKEEEASIVREINMLHPDILMVGLGVPKQEKWISAHLDELNVNLCWAVGAAFEWLSGLRKKAPCRMIMCGFEWLYRLFQEPARLWKRYLIGNIIFIYHVLVWRIRQGFR